MKTRIYLAGFFDTRQRLIDAKKKLEKLGYEVVARWLNERKGAAYSTSTEDYLLGCALNDLQDIQHADIFVLDTIDETPRGGREVELGYALALGVPVLLVGPRRNVFHRLLPRQFESWEPCLDLLEGMVRKDG